MTGYGAAGRGVTGRSVIGAAIGTPFPAPPQEGGAVQVAPGVLWARLPLPMALDHVNVYALADGAGWTVVDTGIDTGRSRAIWERLLAGPLQGRPVTRLIVTHHHPDHVGLAGWFQARGAELLMPRTGWLLARMLVLDVQPVATAEQVAFWRGAGLDAAQLGARSAERPFNFADCVSPMPLGFTRIADGDVLAIGGRVWRIHTGDGHAPEHATLFSDDGLVLGGDQLLGTITPNIGVYPTEPGADPVGEWLASCRRFIPLSRDDQLVLPGHKLPYTGLPGRLAAMIASQDAALQRLLDHLAQPRTAVSCFAPLFTREVGPATIGLALVEAMAHLNHLLRLGQVTRQDRDGVWFWHRADPSGPQISGGVSRDAGA